MSAHTPGPWTYSFRGEYAEIGQPGGVAIGHVRIGALDVATSEANAILVAAAPDLLAACVYALDMLRQMVPDGGRDVRLAERLAGMGGVFAERLLADAVKKATT